MFLTGQEWNFYFDPMVRNPSKTENKPTENKEFQNQEEQISVITECTNLPNLQYLENESDSGDSGSCSVSSGNIKTFRWFISKVVCSYHVVVLNNTR